MQVEMLNPKGSREFQFSTYIYLISRGEQSCEWVSLIRQELYTCGVAKDLKYEGSKVPDEETSIRVYGVAYVILVSAQLKSPLNFAYVD